MAQYQHLPIYKVTYDLLVAVTAATKHFPRDFKTFALRIREDVMDVVLLIYRANSSRARSWAAHQYRPDQGPPTRAHSSG